MIEDELRKYLAENYGTYGQNRLFGPSYADQFRNAAAGLRALDESGADGALKDKYSSAFKSQQASAVLGGGIAAINGLTSILGTRQSLASTNDTDWYDNQVNQLYDVGRTNYDSFDQLASDYTRLGYTPDITFNDVRGMNTGQKIAGVGSSVLSGVTSGYQVGGIYGAIAGGLIGFGTGVEGWVSGDEEAKNKVNISKNNAANANEVAMVNLDAAGERHKEYKFRNAVPNVKEEGGIISRQKLISDFARRVYTNQKQNDRTHSAGFKRKKTEGGTMVRIKMK